MPVALAVPVATGKASPVHAAGAGVGVDAVVAVATLQAARPGVAESGAGTQGGRGSWAFLPAILFEGDLPTPMPSRAVDAGGGMGDGRGDVASREDGGGQHARHLRPLPAGLVDDVWLQPRDPRAWVAHWSANPAHRSMVEDRLGRGRWWVRLRDSSDGGLVVAERPALEHEGSVVVHVDKPLARCIAELGYESFKAGWHVVAATPAPALASDLMTCMDHPVAAPTALTDSMPPSATRTEGGGAAVAAHREPEGMPAEAGRTWEAWSVGGNVDSAAWVLAGKRPGADASGGALRADIAGSGGGRGAAGVPSSEAWMGPGATAEVQRPFRFAVNVEVILHGSTEPDAGVTVGGRPVALRPDGSFSLRWHLPDGDFRVPVVAVSRDGRGRREARLRLLRGTSTVGGVGSHALERGPSDPLAGWTG